ncbi:MAG: hypothetical protein E6R03_04540 [Hyphomicrobiaceae bacterium]|nr:MAG: hypothetical protein E6R03_04540 [Hyphomicrobiaceae bacterium]
MSNLINLINQHALSAAQAGDWQAVANTLNAITIEVRDSTLRTARWLMLQLPRVVNSQTGMTESDIVLGTLRQSAIPRVRAAYDSLVNSGIDLSDDQVQEMIPVLAHAANWPDGLANKILQAGKRTESVVLTNAAACKAAWDEAEALAAAQLLSARRGVLESALRQLPISQIVGDSGLPTQQQVIDRIIEHCNTFGVTFGG